MKGNRIGRRIKSSRENLYMTQEELAEAIGCTTQHISAIERGVKLPRLDTFLAIANTLRVSTDVLLQDELYTAETPLAKEMLTVFAPLSEETQIRILKAIRAFSEDL